MLTYPSSKFGAISGNFKVWPPIYLERIDIPKIDNKPYWLHPSHIEPKNLVNFGPLTNKLQARMLTHPESTMCVLRMLLHFTLGHVTVLSGKFHPFELTLIGLTAPGGLTLGSAPYFLLLSKNAKSSQISVFSSKNYV